MRVHLRTFIFHMLMILIFILSGCGKKGKQSPDSSTTDSEIETETDNIYYSWVDYLSVRKGAGLEQKLLTYLEQGESVEFLGEISSVQSTVTLRCVEFTSPWYLIKRNDGTEGWVFSAALSDEPVDMNHPYRMIIPYCGENLKTASQEWKEHVNNIETLIEVNTEIPMKNIFFLDDKYICIPLGDNTHPVSSFTLSEYMESRYGFDSGNGYFVIENGKDPLFITDLEISEVIQKMEDYFGIDIVSHSRGIIAYITGEPIPEAIPMGGNVNQPFYHIASQLGFGFVHVFEMGTQQITISNLTTNININLNDYKIDDYHFRNRDGYFLINNNQDPLFIPFKKDIETVLETMEDFFDIEISDFYFSATNSK